MHVWRAAQRPGQREAVSGPDRDGVGPDGCGRVEAGGEREGRRMTHRLLDAEVEHGEFADGGVRAVQALRCDPVGDHLFPRRCHDSS